MIDILALVDRPKRPAGPSSEEIYDCPLCDDSGGHLRINRRKNLWHCFKCGDGGLVDPLLNIMNKDKPLFSFDTDKGIKAPITTLRVEDIIEKYEFDTILKKGYRNGSYKPDLIDSSIVEYFLGRGYTLNQLIRYGLSSSPEYPYFGRGILYWRRYKDANPTYFVARAVITPDPRYLNPTNTKDFLWTTFYLDSIPRKMVLVEGALDAIHTSVVCHAGGILGSSLSDLQIEFICDLIDGGLEEIDILLDKPKARKFNEKGKPIRNETDKTYIIYNQIKDLGLKRCRPIFMEHASDPGSASIEYLMQLVS